MSEINKPRDADQYRVSAKRNEQNSIKNETRDGFQTSFGRADPCTQ
jgi:hypothetical protein